MDNKIVKITDSELAFEKAKAEIQKIHSFEKAKEYHDKAEALLSFYKRQHKERHDVQNKIAELKILAAHRAGKILKEMKELGERHPGGKGKSIELADQTQLKDLNISRYQAHVWQKIAELKEDEIEGYKARVFAGKEDTRELTEAGIYRYMVQKKKQKEQSEVNVPKGKYRTIVIDPPWPMQKIIRQERPYQEKNLDYPVLSIQAIKEITLPFSDDGCHVYFWTTQKFLPIAFEIFNQWEVKYIQTLVWHKNVGFTPFGLFMNNVEFVLFGKKGNLPLLKSGEKAVFRGKVREHSRKPDEFYDLVKKVSPEPRIDMFSRERREGFDSWGDEVEKF